MWRVDCVGWDRGMHYCGASGRGLAYLTNKLEYMHLFVCKKLKEFIKFVHS